MIIQTGEYPMPVVINKNANNTNINKHKYEKEIREKKKSIHCVYVPLMKINIKPFVSTRQFLMR